LCTRRDSRFFAAGATCAPTAWRGGCVHRLTACGAERRPRARPGAPPGARGRRRPERRRRRRARRRQAPRGAQAGGELTRASACAWRQSPRRAPQALLGPDHAGTVCVRREAMQREGERGDSRVHSHTVRRPGGSCFPGLAPARMERRTEPHAPVRRVGLIMAAVPRVDRAAGAAAVWFRARAQAICRKGGSSSSDAARAGRTLTPMHLYGSGPGLRIGLAPGRAGGVDSRAPCASYLSDRRVLFSWPALCRQGQVRHENGRRIGPRATEAGLDSLARHVSGRLALTLFAPQAKDVSKRAYTGASYRAYPHLRGLTHGVAARRLPKPLLRTLDKNRLRACLLAHFDPFAACPGIAPQVTVGLQMMNRGRPWASAGSDGRCGETGESTDGQREAFLSEPLVLPSWVIHRRQLPTAESSSSLKFIDSGLKYDL
jgi:hypothetical protein